MMSLCLTLMSVHFELIVWNTHFAPRSKLCITLSPSLPFLYPDIVELLIMRTSNLLLTQTPSYIPLFLALFHCGIHVYLVMSLAHLHLLFLKQVYINTLSPFFFFCLFVCNRDTPYILAYATVVSIALEHKLFIGKRKERNLPVRLTGRQTSTQPS